MYQILLYYKYTPIADPESFRLEQKVLCQRLGLKGRILIAEEGINGTVCGEASALVEYQAATEQWPELGAIEWKTSPGEPDSFPRLRVVVRDEIVTLGLRKNGQDAAITQKAAYIEPSELKALYESGTEFYIIDARNQYEAKLGRFKGALTLPIENFREFPEAVAVPKITRLRDKLVVTYCTGGVRCEKASAYLREQGFTNVRQLHGGVHVYGEEVGGEHFEGELYVFGKRVQMKVNTVNPSVISQCRFCEGLVARYVDCQNRGCGEQFICCETCQEKHAGCCSNECFEKKVHV